MKDVTVTSGKKSRKRGTARAGEIRIRPIGVIRSTLKLRSAAPKQGSEGAPDAWLEVKPFAVPALEGLGAGDEVIVMT
jgi:tRNA (Thr-GGU) A37 N-methylase